MEVFAYVQRFCVYVNWQKNGYWIAVRERQAEACLR